jgi:hypothetical protein
MKIELIPLGFYLFFSLLLFLICFLLYQRKIKDIRQVKEEEEEEKIRQEKKKIEPTEAEKRAFTRMFLGLPADKEDSDKLVDLLVYKAFEVALDDKTTPEESISIMNTLGRLAGKKNKKEPPLLVSGEK